MIRCLDVCIARVSIFECFLFINFARYDIDVVGDDFIGRGMREIIDECWYV